MTLVTNNRFFILHPHNTACESGISGGPHRCRITRSTEVHLNLNIVRFAEKPEDNTLPDRVVPRTHRVSREIVSAIAIEVVGYRVSGAFPI